ncbi:MAG TPA: glycosyltransferase [Gaiellaceae bacterium]|nr:glycosyltransferase [Gaiellaceae bacterium]
MDVLDTANGELAVVVCTLGTKPLAPTLDSIVASAKAAGSEVETLVVWQGDGDPPEGVRALQVFPLGISYARNRGVAELQSRLVGFLDDDELIVESWVAGALAEFADEAPGGAFGPVLSTDPADYPYFRPSGERVVHEGRHRPPWLVGTGGNMVFSRETLVAAGGFDPRLGAGAPVGAAEETDLVLRLLEQGRQLVYTPEMTVYHPSRSLQDEVRARNVYGVGMGVVLRRSPVLSAKYLYTVAQELGRAVRARNRRRRREVTATLRSFLTGLVMPVQVDSPRAALQRLPEELRAKLGGTEPRPLPGVVGERPHLRYAVDGGRVLHLYVNPEPGLERSFDADEVVAAPDAIWALERG